MDDETKASLAAAIAGGYILGRTKKGRLALTTATVLFGRRFGLDPQRLAAQGVQRLRAVPQVSELEDQVRTEGLDAAQRALSSVVGRGVGSITHGIGSRLPGGDAARARNADGGGEEDGDNADDARPEEAAERPARRRRGADPDAGEAATTRPARSAARKRNTAKRAEGPAKKSAAKRPAPATGKAKPVKRAAAPGKKADPAKGSARSARHSSRDDRG